MKLEENVNAFATYGVKRILTACPHCYNTFKNEYRALGYSYDVVHHTELLAQLIADGRLKVTAAAAGGPVTFHDSCYLGRYNGVYEAPRRLLRSTGASLVELPADKRRAYGFCCGAGGGRMWLEETVGKRINHARAEQCLATGAETVAVACAYCLTMLDDGVKDLGAGDRVAVRDVAEVLARTMEGDSSP